MKPKKRKCSTKGCVERRTLYNIAFSKQAAGVATKPNWRCLQHLPNQNELTFVVGLSNEEAAKVGRKVAKDVRDKGNE